MSETNWPDVWVCVAYGVTLLGGFGIAAWLIVEDHPWFALLFALCFASLKFKTGSNQT